MATPSVGIPMPTSPNPTSAAGSDGRTQSAAPAAMMISPTTIRDGSLILRMAPLTTTPPRIAPAPCTLTSTPTNSGGRCRPSPTNA